MDTTRLAAGFPTLNRVSRIVVRGLAKSYGDLPVLEPLDLDIEAAPDLWPTRCDPNQLESALLNLVINARDAMPDGGRIVIATRNLAAAAVAGLPLAAGDYVSQKSAARLARERRHCHLWYLRKASLGQVFRSERTEVTLVLVGELVHPLLREPATR